MQWDDRLLCSSDSHCRSISIPDSHDKRASTFTLFSKMRQNDDVIACMVPKRIPKESSSASTMLDVCNRYLLVSLHDRFGHLLEILSMAKKTSVKLSVKKITRRVEALSDLNSFIASPLRLCDARFAGLRRNEIDGINTNRTAAVIHISCAFV